MTRLPLVLQIDSLDFSPDARAEFLRLASHSASDECGAIVLVAAAYLLAREHPCATADDVHGLTNLTVEFADLVFEVRRLMVIEAGRHPRLRVVAGTDHTSPAQKGKF